MRFSRKAKRELSWILLLVSCVALVYILLFGDGGFLQLRKYRTDVLELQLQNHKLRQNHLDYLHRIDSLKRDPAALERVARERYNFARPGDIIVNLHD